MLLNMSGWMQETCFRGLSCIHITNLNKLARLVTNQSLAEYHTICRYPNGAVPALCVLDTEETLWGVIGDATLRLVNIGLSMALQSLRPSRLL